MMKLRIDGGNRCRSLVLRQARPPGRSVTQPRQEPAEEVPTGPRPAGAESAWAQSAPLARSAASQVQSTAVRTIHPKTSARSDLSGLRFVLF